MVWETKNGGIFKMPNFRTRLFSILTDTTPLGFDKYDLFIYNTRTIIIIFPIKSITKQLMKSIIIQ